MFVEQAGVTWGWQQLPHGLWYTEALKSKGSVLFAMCSQVGVTCTKINMSVAARPEVSSLRDVKQGIC
jgi:hypothetical protein